MKKNGLGKNQFWADINISEYFPEWKQIFMRILIKYFKKYRIHGLIYPELVKEHSAQYINY